MRYAYALTSALLLGGAVTTVAFQRPATAQTAQNEPGAIEAVAPKAGAPMSFADMVAKLQPAVVNVSTAQKITQTAQANPFAGTPFGELFGGGGGGGDGQPVTREAQSLGSGFLISPDGYVVTNNHVIAAGAKGATVESITVTLADRKEYKARLVGRDQASDLALLKIDTPGTLPFVKFGDSTRSRVGDWVVAIGQPFGLGGTVTAGIISALHRQTGLGSPYDRFIQTDAAINQGNSGGPMFNLNGDVIGINSQIYSQSGGNIGIGFAIPAEEARPIIDKLRSGSKISRGYLGVGIQAVTADVAQSLAGVTANQGEVIGRIEPGGPGARAGLHTGDVVTRVNGTLVTPDTTLAYQVANVAPGSPVRLDIVRDGRAQTINATVGTRPPEEQLAANASEDDDGIPGGDGTQGQPAAANALGMTVQPLTPAIARSLGVDGTMQGVVIASVDPQSDAGLKGLKRGDVISAVNSVPVRTGADLAHAVTSAKAAGRTQVLLLLSRGKGNQAYLPVKIKS